VRRAQVIRKGVVHVQADSPLKRTLERECSLVMTKADQVIEVESPSDTRDDSEIEVREKSTQG